MIVAIALSAILIAVVTAIHFGALRLASQFVTPSRHPGQCLAVAVTAIVLAHTAEALLYAAGFWLAVHDVQIGDLVSSPAGKGGPLTFMDYFYFSLVNYTTLGRGDLMPDGHLRFMTAMEAFHGFLLITASGTFILQIMGGKKPLAS
ncbi:ion channel [Allohahella sp. A8]|uniref:ion channel n=1 Tax=Allohahella sp. A8 TaxID=3141461 RepID=UPI003A80597F